jgi:hypothetical protein
VVGNGKTWQVSISGCTARYDMVRRGVILEGYGLERGSAKERTYALAIEQIRKILADDKNYQADSLKLGGIWDICDRAASYRRGTHAQGTFVEVADAHETGVFDAPSERYVRYYRDVLTRISNGYDTPQSLAKLALDWEIPAPEHAQKAGESQT